MRCRTYPGPGSAVPSGQSNGTRRHSYRPWLSLQAHSPDGSLAYYLPVPNGFSKVTGTQESGSSVITLAPPLHLEPGRLPTADDRPPRPVQVVHPAVELEGQAHLVDAGRQP